MGIIDLIFPKSCLDCGKSGAYFCQNCLAKVKAVNEFDPISKTFSVFRYEGVIRKGIIKLKYGFAFDIAGELAEVSAKNLQKNPYFKFKNTSLVSIPLHKSRQNWRGFNQSEIVGKLIAEKLNWGFEQDLLIRLSQGKTQVGLPKSERVRNIRGKFAVNPEAKTKIDKNNVYIVFDDVATTGATIKEAMKVLEKGGAKNIFGLTIGK
jgi:competence protein ComFC